MCILCQNVLVVNLPPSRASRAGPAPAQRDVLEVLRRLALKGCIVTADAANCQLGNARIVSEQGGNYVFALKDDHPQLYADVAEMVAREGSSDFKAAVAITRHALRSTRYAGSVSNRKRRLKRCRAFNVGRPNRASRITLPAALKRSHSSEVAR